MDVRFLPHGIFLPQIGLWLDPMDDCGSAWISHGHSDHARGCHGRIFATPDTLKIYRARLPESTPESRPVEYGVPWDIGPARLTAYPASHIVGAVQLLVEFEGERLLYTGDIKLRPPLCGRETQVVACDRLIVESTFGLPIYRFLSREAARGRIVAFARETLETGSIPAFIGYSLGRGQEIVHVLCEAGIPVSVHGSIARFIPVYEDAGYAFPGWTPYRNGDTAGKALVTLPAFPNILEASGKLYRIAYVSGWAALDNARARVAPKS